MIAALTLAALGGLTIELPAETSVSGLELSLGAVAVVHGDDPDLVARAEALGLGYAPAPGFQRVLEAERVRAELARELPGIELTVSGAPRCRVLAATITVASADLRERARTVLREALGDADADLAPCGELLDLEVPQPLQGLELEPVWNGRAPSAGAWSVPVRVYVDGELYRTVSTAWDVALWQRRSVLRRSVRAGEELAPTDFETRRVRVGTGPESGALAPEQLGTAVARRDLEAGAIVTARDVERRVVLHRGDVVSLEVRRGGVQVRALVTALGDGHVGDRVRVRCEKTGKELVARVRSSELVALTFE